MTAQPFLQGYGGRPETYPFGTVLDALRRCFPGEDVSQVTKFAIGQKVCWNRNGEDNYQPGEILFHRTNARR
jgi:hypothetical protein